MKINERTTLIRPRRLYREGMSSAQAYEITRKHWRARPDRHRPDYAFTVHRGVVRHVFRIDHWKREASSGRWMFEGAVDDALERKYVGHSVKEYFPRGAANPVRYMNC